MIRKSFLLFSLMVGTLLMPINAQDQGEAGRFQAAESRLESGDYRLAESLFREFLRDYDESSLVPRAMLGLGRAVLKNGRPAAAAEVLLELGRRFPDEPAQLDALYWRGVARYSLDESVVAVDLFSQFLEEGVESPLRFESYQYLAWSQFRNDHAGAALETLQRFWTEGGTIDYSFPVLSLTASLYLQEGMEARLLELLRSGNPETLPAAHHAERRMYEAESLYRLKKNEAAVELFESVLNDEVIEANRAEPFRFSIKRLFAIYEADQSFSLIVEKALQAVDLFGAGDPDARAMLLRAAFLGARRDDGVDPVLELTSPLIAHDPFDAAAWSYRLEALIASQDSSPEELLPDELIDRLERAEGLKPLAGGDYLLMKLLRSRLQQKEWQSCRAGAVALMRLYPESDFYMQALWLTAWSGMKLWDAEAALRRIERDPVYQNPNGGFPPGDIARVLLLQAYLNRQLERYPAAVALYRRYFEGDQFESVRNESLADGTAVRNFFNSALTAFQAADFAFMEQQTAALLALNDQTSPGQAYAELALYFRGLSAVAAKEYRRALDSLDSVNRERLVRESLGEVVPWLTYYRGWCRYRLGEYLAATELFNTLIQQRPDHALASDALKLAGWASLSGGHYSAAADFFKRYSEENSGIERDQARFLYGRSLALGGEIGGGREILSSLSQMEGSEFADDALMELGRLDLQEGAHREASETFLQLEQRDRGSAVGEEAAYSAAEALFIGGYYAEAADLYSQYRRKYPKGFNYQAALYRGALSLRKADDEAGALFLYQRLYDRYPEGPYASEALIAVAELHTARKQWQEAAEFYRLLQDRYPDEAAAIKASQRLNSLFFRAQGRDTREAELLTVIEREKGMQRRKGRDAILQLSDLYLNLYRSPENRKRALEWLDLIKVRGEKEPERASLAWRLIGDDAFREGDAKAAITAYLEAAMLAVDEKTASNILYRAVMTSLEAGSTRDTLTILNTMEERFPQSDWTHKAKQLPGVIRLLKEAGNE